MTTWREELKAAMGVFYDPGPVLAYAPDEATFDIEFDAGYGDSEGAPVLAWTQDRVYFPVVYEGAEWLGPAPRSPVKYGQEHVGGQ